MGLKEPTRNQYSKGLGFQAKTPPFLLALQQQIAGADPRAERSIGDGSDGRVPIPTRPDGESSGDEEDRDELPQVVVLKEGRHLTALQVENEKRKAKGLPPLPEKPAESEEKEPKPSLAKEKPADKNTLSYSSGKGVATIGSSSNLGKRKVIGGDGDTKKQQKSTGSSAPKKQKKPAKKGPLSFGDDDN